MRIQDLIARGTRAAQPAATTVSAGAVYYVTDEVKLERSSGTAWEDVSAGGAIANDAVTYAKIQNVSAASKLLGRGSAGGAGDPEEITLGSGLTMTGTTLAASGGGGGGAVVQVKNVQTGAMATGTTVMPIDDTIPQNTEGDEYMTLAITPTNAAHTLKIEIVAMLSSGLTNAWMSGGLFQDAGAGALAASTVWLPSTASVGVPINFTHYMTAGTTSATTFKFRAGGSGAGTTTFNGNGGARLLGGVMASSITITEIVP